MKRTRSGEIIIFTILVAVVFVALQALLFQERVEKTGEEFMGTDPYTRMVRAEELYKGGRWYDPVMERSNSPYGEELHWTRPMDAAIISGAWLMRPFLDPEKAFKASCIYVSPLLGVLSIASMMFCAVHMFGRKRAPLALIVFFSQFFTLQYFIFGRPDHHSLIMLLFIVFLAGAFRLAEKRGKGGWGKITALTAALAFWVSVETIVFVVMISAVLFIEWLFTGGDAIDRLRDFSIHLLIFTGAFLVAERPIGNLPALEYDKISYPYIMLFALLALFSFGGTRLRSKRMLARFLYSAVAASAGLAAMALAFPGMLKGPFSDVNPAIVPIWLSKVVEVQSIMSLDTGKAIMYMGLPLLATLALTSMFLKKRISKPGAWGVVLSGLIVYLPLGFYQVRWSAYAQILSVFPAVLILNEIFGKIEKSSPEKWKGALRMLSVGILCMGFFFVGIIPPLSEGKAGEGGDSASELWVVCEWMNLQDFGEEPVILANQDMGPQILYRTDMRVIATPYHRNDEGILFYYDSMAEKDMARAEAMLKEREVKLVLQRVEENIADSPQNEKPDFKSRLENGNVPGWMSEVKMPEELFGYELYEILD